MTGSETGRPSEGQTKGRVTRTKTDGQRNEQVEGRRQLGDDWLLSSRLTPVTTATRVPVAAQPSHQDEDEGEDVHESVRHTDARASKNSFE